MELDELKKRYEVLQKKYKLPGFDELNSRFDIGKIERYTGNLLRDIRAVMMERIVHYVRLLELMLNPGQATPIFMILLREINNLDKEVMNRVFNGFVSLELKSFKLDVDSIDEKEAEHIKEIFEIWNKTRDDLIKLVDIMERNLKSGQKKKDKDYFN